MHKIKGRAQFVFNYFGLKEQIRKLDEEHGELTRKLGLLEEGVVTCKKGFKEDVAQEIADNLFLLLQFAQALKVEKKVHEQLYYKSKRTTERINEGYFKRKEQK